MNRLQAREELASIGFTSQERNFIGCFLLVAERSLWLTIQKKKKKSLNQ